MSREGQKIWETVKTTEIAWVSTVYDISQLFSIIRGARVIIGAKLSFILLQALIFSLSKEVSKYPLDFDLLIGGHDNSLNSFIQMLSQSRIYIH